ncbi:substrate-binding domain-containing protein [Streptomyces sp. NPDC028635]|uniref:LacI family DNA-binding transcriptional regulator n=1 Tax=Streptomyces sp. NPDC028635 TaxID=3154800 RepID=UPI00340C7704
MVRTGSASGAGGPTLAVVARETGVSVPTVSKVVNGRQDVAPETRLRVTEALDRLGYVRRPRFDAVRPPRLVDLVVHSLDGSRSGAVLHGVERAAHDAGLDVVVSAEQAGGNAGRPRRGWPDRLGARGTAGVLFHLAELTEPQQAWLERRRVPFVMVDPAVEPRPGVVSVGAANWQGGVTATEHLLGLGHRRIAVIAGQRQTTASGARVAGYRSALSAAGVRHRPEYVRHAGAEEACVRHAGAEEACVRHAGAEEACVRHAGAEEAAVRRRVRELLALPEPPTAVFVCSDRMALGVCEALTERGLSVPDDVSVVGFDDAPEARWSAPALTTVRQPLAEMAATALGLLVRMMDGDRPDCTRTELSTRLIRRASTAPPKDS